MKAPWLQEPSKVRSPELCDTPHCCLLALKRTGISPEPDVAGNTQTGSSEDLILSNAASLPRCILSALTPRYLLAQEHGGPECLQLAGENIQKEAVHRKQRGVIIWTRARREPEQTRGFSPTALNWKVRRSPTHDTVYQPKR